MEQNPHLGFPSSFVVQISVNSAALPVSELFASLWSPAVVNELIPASFVLLPAPLPSPDLVGVPIWDPSNFILFAGDTPSKLGRGCVFEF